MAELFLVMSGGAIGAALRYGTSQVTYRIFPDSDTITGTVVANSAGCFIAGMLIAVSDAGLLENTHFILFLTVGLLGSFTTFSTFSLELFHRLYGSLKTLLVYLLLQLGVGLGLVIVGYTLVARFYGG